VRGQTTGRFVASQPAICPSVVRRQTDKRNAKTRQHRTKWSTNIYTAFKLVYLRHIFSNVHFLSRRQINNYDLLSVNMMGQCTLVQACPIVNTMTGQVTARLTSINWPDILSFCRFSMTGLGQVSFSNITSHIPYMFPEQQKNAPEAMGGPKPYWGILQCFSRPPS